MYKRIFVLKIISISVCCLFFAVDIGRAANLPYSPSRGNLAAAQARVEDVGRLKGAVNKFSSLRKAVPDFLKKNKSEIVSKSALLYFFLISSAILISVLYTSYHLDSFIYVYGAHMASFGKNPYIGQNVADFVFEHGADYLVNIPVTPEMGLYGDPLNRFIDTSGYVASPFNLFLFYPFIFFNDFGHFGQIYLLLYVFFFQLSFALLLKDFLRKFVITKAARVLSRTMQVKSSENIQTIGYVLLILALFDLTLLIFYSSFPIFTSYGFGQIDFFYFFSVTLAIYLLSENVKNEKKGFLFGAVALLAIASFIKVFPAIILLGLLGGSFVKALPNEEKRHGLQRKNSTIYFKRLFLYTAISVATLFLLSVLYPGPEYYFFWYERLQTLALVSSHFSLVAYLGDVWDVQGGLIALLIRILLGYLFYSKVFKKNNKSIDALDIAALISLLPTFSSELWQPYYHSFLIIPILVSFSKIYNLKISPSKTLSLSFLLAVAFILSQGTIKLMVYNLFAVMDSPAVTLLEHYTIYPVTVALFFLIVYLRSLEVKSAQNLQRKKGGSHRQKKRGTASPNVRRNQSASKTTPKRVASEANATNFEVIFSLAA